MGHGADLLLHSLVQRGKDRGDLGSSQASGEVNNFGLFLGVNCRIIYDGDGVVKKTLDRVILSVAVAFMVPVCILQEGVLCPRKIENRVVESNTGILLAELQWIASIVIPVDFLKEGLFQLSMNLLPYV